MPLNKSNWLAKRDSAFNLERGRTPNSTKSLSMSVRGGEMKATGADENGRDYTAEELINAAQQLINLSARFTKFLEGKNLGEDVSEPST